ncbi:MAG: hypothetical protein EOM50_12185 [Erysipelotrichia bacterium]|nr:hypothetical protein [Erysipelotrichia bacterium]
MTITHDEAMFMAKLLEEGLLRKEDSKFLKDYIKHYRHVDELLRLKNEKINLLVELIRYKDTDSWEERAYWNTANLLFVNEQIKKLEEFL